MTTCLCMQKAALVKKDHGTPQLKKGADSKVRCTFFHSCLYYFFQWMITCSVLCNGFTSEKGSCNFTAEEGCQFRGALS